ncbi:hypothetical protein DL93DRAFT_2163831 [Clavulina sp. PMI_390]|nr:hypothetical protein DL93DRAFT_2163831 [Clavulina sp. PMI_390]
MKFFSASLIVVLAAVVSVFAAPIAEVHAAEIERPLVWSFPSANTVADSLFLVSLLPGSCLQLEDRTVSNKPGNQGMWGPGWRREETE